MSEMQEHIDDYLRSGVKFVWVIDPRTRRAYVYTAAGMHEAHDGVLRACGPDISVVLGDVLS